jgi:hypothetical protein
MTIKAYSIEEELKYHKKITRKKPHFLHKIQSNLETLQALAKENKIQIELGANDYTYTFGSIS